MRCHICGSPRVKPITALLHSLVHLESTGVAGAGLMKCLTCGTYFLTTYYPDEFLSQEPITGYADLDFEAMAFEIRKEFFAYLRQLSEHYGKLAGKRLLDIGCGFGHLLKVFKAGGCEVYGVEILDSLRETLRHRGYVTFKYVTDIPKEQKFDIISLIDSLCYFEDPNGVLLAAKGYLKEDGIIIVRTSNRGLLIDLWRQLGRDLSSIIGTGKYNFGLKGLKIMLENADYKIIEVIYYEKGKKMSVGHKLLYNLAAMMSYLTKLELSSGVIVVAKSK